MHPFSRRVLTIIGNVIGPHVAQKLDNGLSVSKNEATIQVSERARGSFCDELVEGRDKLWEWKAVLLGIEDDGRIKALEPFDHRRPQVIWTLERWISEHQI